MLTNLSYSHHFAGKRARIIMILARGVQARCGRSVKFPSTLTPSLRLHILFGSYVGKGDGILFGRHDSSASQRVVSCYDVGVEQYS